ncbi:MAG: hypothetical protein HC796_05575 [Synechococcaceae cyanobacterium RL_1_2]|nr:hypothetical protein [Synechococcaceae cyanobacterium RL_1_2]
MGDSRNIYRALEGLSQSYFALGEYQSSSLRFLSEWLEEARNNNNLQEQLLALSLGGDYYQEFGSVENALNLYQQALTIAKTLDDEARIALLTNKIAQIISVYPQFISR